MGIRYTYTAIEASKLPYFIEAATGKEEWWEEFEEDNKGQAFFGPTFGFVAQYLLSLPTPEWMEVRVAVAGVPERREGDQLNYLDPAEVKRASLALRAVVPPPMQAALRANAQARFPDDPEGIAKRKEFFQENIGDFARLRAFYEFAALGGQAVIIQVG